MPSLWETMGYMTICACFNNLGVALKAPVSVFFVVVSSTLNNVWRSLLNIIISLKKPN